MKTEARLKELGIELPDPTAPLANYVNAVRTGNLLFLAGKGPGLPGKPLPTGKVGRDMDVATAKQHARSTGISLIAAMKAEEAGLEVRDSVMASDAFFPFRDGIDTAAKAGIRAVIQPGGSLRDDEVIAAADENDMAMVFTGVRHFRH